MSTELAVLEVSENNYPKIYCVGGLDAFYQKAKSEVEGEVPDLSTGKGRDRIAKLAADVSRSKTAVENPGRAYNKFLKAQPKLIDKELREYCDKMDQLRDDTRAPLTAWETIDKAEKKQIADTAAYLIKFAADLEEGYRDNELIDLKAKQAEIERQAEIDKAAAEAKTKAKEDAAEEIKQAKLDKEKAEAGARFAVAAAADAKWLTYISEAYSYNDQLIAAQNARNAVLRSQKEEADRTAKAKEAREADLDNRHAKNVAAKNAIVELGFNSLSATALVKAIAKGLIPGVTINY